MRSSSLTASTARCPGSAAAPISVSVCTMPETQMTRTASGAFRGPRPKTTSAGAAIGTAAEVSIFCRRLPARISTFAPTPPLFDTRPASRTANEWLRLPPSFT